MTPSLSQLADLLSDCDGSSIRLALADGGGLEIDAPRGVLTPGRLAQIKARKRDLLDLIPPGWPSGFCIPSWWPELAGVFPAGFLAEARATTCGDPECLFGIAVRWPGADGATWSCPRCGLTSKRQILFTTQSTF